MNRVDQLGGPIRLQNSDIERTESAMSSHAPKPRRRVWSARESSSAAVQSSKNQTVQGQKKVPIHELDMFLLLNQREH